MGDSPDCPLGSSADDLICRNSSNGGMVNPSAFAVFRLMMKSYLLASSTGSSASRLRSFKIFSTSMAHVNASPHEEFAIFGKPLDPRSSLALLVWPANGFPEDRSTGYAFDPNFEVCAVKNERCGVDSVESPPAGGGGKRRQSGTA